MPNYIKNRIEIIGSKKEVDALIKRFSTSYKEEQHKSCDGDDTYKNDDGDNGWLNVETNIFKRRAFDNVIGVPDGFKPYMIDAWTRFPDFDKIIPMPKSLNVTSDNWLMPLENQFCINTKFKDHMDEFRNFCEKNPKRKNEMIENFINGVRNYIEYGQATWYNWSVKNWGTKWNSSECKKLNEVTFEFETAWSGIPELINKISIKFPKVKILYEYSDEDTGCNCGTGIYLNGEVKLDILENSSKEAYDLAFKLRPDYLKYYKLIDGSYEYIEED